jgi:hypothetical protein
LVGEKPSSSAVASGGGPAVVELELESSVVLVLAPVVVPLLASPVVPVLVLVLVLVLALASPEVVLLVPVTASLVAAALASLASLASLAPVALAPLASLASLAPLVGAVLAASPGEVVVASLVAPVLPLRPPESMLVVPDEAPQDPTNVTPPTINHPLRFFFCIVFPHTQTRPEKYANARGRRADGPTGRRARTLAGTSKTADLCRIAGLRFILQSP